MSIATELIAALTALDVGDVYRDDQVPENVDLPIVTLADFEGDTQLLLGDDATLVRDRTLVIAHHARGGPNRTIDDTDPAAIIAALDQVAFGGFPARVTGAVRDYDPDAQVITHLFTVEIAYRP